MAQRKQSGKLRGEMKPARRSWIQPVWMIPKDYPFHWILVALVTPSKNCHSSHRAQLDTPRATASRILHHSVAHA